MDTEADAVEAVRIMAAAGLEASWRAPYIDGPSGVMVIGKREIFQPFDADRKCDSWQEPRNNRTLTECARYIVAREGRAPRAVWVPYTAGVHHVVGSFGEQLAFVGGSGWRAWGHGGAPLGGWHPETGDAGRRKAEAALYAAGVDYPTEAAAPAPSRASLARWLDGAPDEVIDDFVSGDQREPVTFTVAVVDGCAKVTAPSAEPTPSPDPLATLRAEVAALAVTLAATVARVEAATAAVERLEAARAVPEALAVEPVRLRAGAWERGRFFPLQRRWSVNKFAAGLVQADGHVDWYVLSAPDGHGWEHSDRAPSVRAAQSAADAWLTAAGVELEGGAVVDEVAAWDGAMAAEREAAPSPESMGGPESATGPVADIVARLTAERDEARAALGSVSDVLATIRAERLRVRAALATVGADDPLEAVDVLVERLAGEVARLRAARPVVEVVRRGNDWVVMIRFINGVWWAGPTAGVLTPVQAHASLHQRDEAHGIANLWLSTLGIAP